MKVLLISHNPISTYQSMGKTFCSLFSSFEKDELCQLYVYPSYPNIDIMNSYYRITDRDALKAILQRGCVGNEIAVHEYKGNIIENKTDGIVFHNKQSNSQPRNRLLRDAIWKLSGWYSQQLKEWLDKEVPSCIFLAPGYAKFIYDIALKISEDRKIPLIVYVCDDYYFAKKPEKLIARYQFNLLQNKIQYTMKNAKILIAISEEIREKYSDEFAVATEVIMTGSDFNLVNNISTRDKINGLSYFGNVGVNRERSLADIGRVLDEINDEKKTNYYLKIYTNTNNGIVASAFREIKSIKMCDFLVGDKFIKEFLNADCLVHVEDFSKESIDLVKGSISTKIADSLSSGIPLLAYGPEGIASIEHLKQNDCAFLAHDYNTLKTVIYELINDNLKRKQIAERALSVAKQYHCASDNSRRLKSIIEQLQEKI